MNDEFKRRLIDMEDVDEEILKNKPWVQDFLTKVNELTKKAVLNWCNVICKIGENELDLEDYISIFTQQVGCLYEDLILDVEAIQEKSLDKIMKLLEKIQSLCKDLQIEIPTINYEEISLSELRKVLVQRMDEYESKVQTRRGEIQQLQSKLTELCKSLGREPKVLSLSPLPRPEEVESFRDHMESLENEVMDREEKFYKLREQIMEIVQELEIPPTLDFEKKILDMNDVEVMITDSDMEELELYHNRLCQQARDTKEEISELRNKVDDLWNKLEIDILERDSFRQKNIGNSVNTLKALKAELGRLETMKKANFFKFIHKQRQELEQMWQKCHCTHDEKHEFLFFYSDCYNEDLFELHEREIDKWKAYYEDNKELFQLLEQHKKLWNELRELELNSDGANRFKNRGGKLLTEEKQRNKLSKRIPKLEESLTKLAEVYYHHKGKHFHTFGQTISEYLNKLHEDKDKDFKLKLSAKKQMREQASTIGRSARKLFLLSPSPAMSQMSCFKRKVITTPETEPLKKLKTTASSSRCLTARNKGMPKLNVSRSRRLSLKRRRQRLSFTSSSSSNKENNNGSATTTYCDFAKEVSTRNECRSTGFVLKENNQWTVEAGPSKAGTDNFQIPRIQVECPTPLSSRWLQNKY